VIAPRPRVPNCLRMECVPAVGRIGHGAVALLPTGLPKPPHPQFPLASIATDADGGNCNFHGRWLTSRLSFAILGIRLAIRPDITSPQKEGRKQEEAMTEREADVLYRVARKPERVIAEHTLLRECLKSVPKSARIQEGRFVRAAVENLVSRGFMNRVGELLTTTKEVRKALWQWLGGNRN